MTYWEQKARDTITAALDALGTGPELTCGMVVAQLDPAERTFLRDVPLKTFGTARNAWAKQRDEICRTRWPKWFGKVEAGLFAAAPVNRR